MNLASNSGWSEDYILWKLPMSRATIYMEAIAAMNGADVIPTQGGYANEIDQMRAEIMAKIAQTKAG